MELIVFVLVILLIVVSVVAWSLKEENNYLRREIQRLRDQQLPVQSYEDFMEDRKREAIKDGTFRDPFQQFRAQPFPEEKDDNINPS